MGVYVKRDDVKQMLDDMGDYDAKPGSWEAGWNKAINTAVKKLGELPTAEFVEDNKIYLKPCPFCGEKEIISKVSGFDYGRYCFEIGCKVCNYSIKNVLTSKREYVSFNEMLKFIKQAANKWNTRYNEGTAGESEVEENA